MLAADTATMTRLSEVPSDFGSRHGHVKQDDDPAGTASSLAGGLPFDALLAVTRTYLGRELRGRGFESQSAERMFEPRITDAHQRRQAEMKQNFRTELQDDAIRAPANQRDGRTSEGQGSLYADTTRDDNGAPADRPAPSSVPGRAASSAANRPAAFAGPADVRPADETNRRNGPAHPAVPATDAANGAELGPLTSALGGSQTRSSAAAAPAGGPTMATKGNMAQQVGRALGEGGASGTESTRSVEAPVAPATQGDHTGQAKPRSRQLSEAPRPHDEAAARRVSEERPAAFKDLVRALQVRRGEKHSTARMQLDPPELGRMRVNVSLRHDRLYVEVRTETEEATHLMNERVAALKAALAAHGVTVERFDVAYDNPGMGRFGAAPDGFAGAHGDPQRSGSDGEQWGHGSNMEDPDPELWSIMATATHSSRQLIDVSI